MKYSAGKRPRMSSRTIGGRIHEQKFLAALRGSGKHRAIVSDARSIASVQHIRDVLAILSRHPHYYKGALGDPFPSTIARLKRIAPLSPQPLLKELVWGAARLLCHKAQLIAFIQYRDQISQEIASGNLESAQTTLDHMVRQLGESIFSLHLRLILTQGLSGREARKSLVRKIYNTEGVDGYIYYLSYYLASRLDPSGSQDKINVAVGQLRRSSTRQIAIHAHMQLRLTSETTFSDEQLAGVLREEATSSLIDLYDAFIRVLQLLVLGKSEHLFSQVLANTLSELHKSFDDHRLRRIFSAIQMENPQPSSLGCKYAAARDQYCRGNLSEAGALALEELRDNAEHAMFIRMASEALAEECIGAPDGSTFAEAAVKLLATVYLYSEDSERAGKELERLCLSFSCFDWALFPLAYLHEAQQRPKEELYSIFWGLAVLSAKFDMPELLMLRVDPCSHETVNSCLTLGWIPPAFAESLDLAMLRPSPENVISALDPAEECAVRSKSALLKGDLVAASTAWNGNSRLGFARRLDAISVVATALAKRNDIATAIELLVSSYLERPQSPQRFDLRRLLEELDRKPSPIPMGSLAKAIAFSIFFSYGILSKDKKVAYSYDEVLRSVNSRKPSGLAPYLSRYENAQARYFLKDICIQPIMDQIPGFYNSRELDEERIAVAKILAENFPECEKECLEEIKLTTRKLVIYDGLKRVEQSKIYVDVDNLRKALHRNLDTSFERYAAYSKSREVAQDITELQQKRLAVQGDDERHLESFALPQEEMPKLLEKIVVSIWHEFLVGSEYSLNVYLSVRIRHGTLEGQLRNPLVAHNLVTQKDGKSGSYKPNSYWAGQKCDLSCIDQSQFQAVLAGFSSFVDETTALLNDEYLRINLNGRGRSLFRFILTPADINDIECALPEDPTLDNLIDIVLNELWRRLDVSLSLIRDYFNSLVMSVFMGKLHDLEISATALGIGSACPDFMSAVARARTDVASAILRAANWFKLSKSFQFVDFSIDMAIAIAAESARNYFGKSTLEYDADVPELRMVPGRFLLSFVDVFYIIFENVVKRSGLAENTVSVSVSYYEGLLSITVNNKISPETDKSDARAKLEAKRKSLDGDISVEVVSGERGSGFHKLKKILGSDLGCLNTFDFDIKGDDFVVDIVIELAGL